jgi:hypothetical protein
MIPRTFPSTYASNGQQQMVVYFLPSIAGLQRWLDYIPVKLAQGGVENSYANNGYIDVTVVSYPTASQQAWKEYIPVYLDDAATDAWQVNARGYIPYGYALFGDASMIMDMTNTGALDPRVTFSRTSNATQFDSSGNLVYAPHNLLTQSESFDASVWTKTNATVTANAVAAPNGTTTADKLVEDTATGEHAVGVPFPFVAGVVYTQSVYAKAAERTLLRVGAGNPVTWAAGVVVDLSNGTITSTSAGTGSVVDAGNGWYRISVTGTALATASTNASVRLVSTGTTLSYTGDGVSGLFLWGAQLNVGTLQPYYPTTVKSLLGYTQEFDNAGWAKTRTSVSANVAIDPQGFMTADKLVEDTAAGTHIIEQGSLSVVSGGTYTLSVYAKDSGRFLQLTPTLGAFSAGPFANFNLAAGTVSASGGGATASITNVGNGWYRCSLTATATATTTTTLFLLLSTSGTSLRFTPSYTGDGTSGIFLWGAQLSDSASLDEYVYNPVAAPTSTAYYGPRFDYDPVTLAARGLLIEEQRTNSIRNNTMQGAVAGTPGTLPTNWGLANTGSLTTQVVGSGTSAGISYVDLRISGTTSTTNSRVYYEAGISIAGSVNQSWTNTQYLAVVGGSTSNVSSVLLIHDENDAAGVLLVRDASASFVSALTSALKRFSFTNTLGNASIAFLRPGIQLGFASGATIDITLRIGLPQLELGAFATSVIPTTTAAATRTADVAVMQGANFSNWYRQDEGTLFAEATTQKPPTASGTVYGVAIDDGTTNNFISPLRFSGSDIRGRVDSGAVIQAQMLTVGVYTVNVYYKSAIGYKVDDFAVSTNGTLGPPDNSGSIPATVVRLSIGALSTLVNTGHIRRISYWPRRLANAELQGVTA